MPHKTVDAIQTQMIADLEAIIDATKVQTAPLRAQIMDLQKQIQTIEGPEVQAARQQLQQIQRGGHGQGPGAQMRRQGAVRAGVPGQPAAAPHMTTPAKPA